VRKGGRALGTPIFEAKAAMPDPRAIAARRGCLVVVVSVIAVSAAAYYVNQWISHGGPPADVLRAQARALVEEALAPREIREFAIDAVYPRRGRATLSVDTWQVEGSLTSTADGDSPLRGGFLAVVHATCGDYSDIGCWQLRRLSVGDRVIAE